MSVISKLVTAAAAGVSTGPEGAWDLSYAYYDDPFAGDISNAGIVANFSIAGQDTSAYGLFFKPDGTRMYVVGAIGDDVNEYSLSTPWVVTTASYVQNFSVSSQDTTPYGIFFRFDGTKMYVVGGTGDDINEYNLSTAWDVSTASYARRFSVAAQDTNPMDVFFKSDGTKMYVLGFTNPAVYEYDLSTAWRVDTASYSQSFSVSAQDTFPFSFSFNSNGTKMYVLGSTGQDVNEYTLSTAWDISTASYVQNFSVSAQDTQSNGLYTKPDGSGFYVLGAQNDRVYQYTMSGFSVSAQETSPQGLFFNSDGDKMYVVGNASDAVKRYNLSTAWDLSTASFSQSFSVAGQETNPSGLFFKPDGTKMYVVGFVGDDVNEYSLGTAWDLSTTTFSQTFSVATQTVQPLGVSFKSDGTKMYILGGQFGGKDVNEYTLSTAWDISTASYSQRFSVSTEDTKPEDLFFKPDGTKMYILGNIGDDVNEYNLSTAWDISTASYVQNFSVVENETNVTGLFFKDDGTQMFVTGISLDRIFTYSLGVQP